ncbi:MAG: DUF4157 domain-containing protein [Pyrinomonadaceae bacterium]|nr:DUF4157 domain-containing protein [Pyrinomonadaceae bacterium]
MKLARESHRRLEKFFREYFNDPQLKLPPIFLHRGRLARLVTKRLRIGAITVGRHIFIAPERVVEADGNLSTKGWLIAHEATHVLQYEYAGYIRFFLRYFYNYWVALRGSEAWDGEARMKAYLAIEAERIAHEVERAYQAWSDSSQT